MSFGEGPSANPQDLLLRVPDEDHQLWNVTDPDAVPLSMQGHKRYVKYHENMRDVLVAKGLWQVGQIDAHDKLDHALITALLERWRPETHTFHMATGEITVTLQDVAIIWGLPVGGPPVTGYSDVDLVEHLTNTFGVQLSTNAFKNKKVGTKKDGSDSRRLLYYSLRLAYLKERFGNENYDHDDEVEMQSRMVAFITELIGTLIVPDSSKDCVSSMYAQFISFEQPRRYSWASALLACLYRNLCNASRRNTRSIAGPLYFLQIWSWEHFAVARRS